jgi:hypothetical protein
MKLLLKSLNVFRIKTFSPQGFLMWAGVFAAFFAFCHIAGWREHTTFISGTVASADGDAGDSALRGVLYLFSYFGFLLLTPIFALAAGMWAGSSMFRRKQVSSASTQVGEASALEASR